MKKYFCLFLICLNIMSFNINELVDNEISITAHRGSSQKYPENTLISIEDAINNNVDFIEIDVRISKDNQIVLFHDSNLIRIDGTNRKIEEMTLEELSMIDYGSYKNVKYKNVKIPTLIEVFENYRGKVKFNIELKKSDDIEQNYALLREVSSIINKYDMNDYIIISSFDKELLDCYKIDNPNCIIGLITGKELGNVKDLNYDFISINYKSVTKDLVRELHDKNIKIHVWTVNDKRDFRKVIDLGVDSIITNDIDTATIIIKEN